MALCGPKLSLFGLIVSVWGIIQLSLMGMFFYTHSVAFAEDLGLEHPYDDYEKFQTDADAKFLQNALNCWIAACIYVVTLCFSVHQFWLNNRTSV
ncbi:ribonuclease kappa-B-like [Artemia franciscana]|uniref:ribonuclease kappa-B-like n=1 Tax=Artemia franciscana TaxID=6661 RepID=UPI0032DA2DFC